MAVQQESKKQAEKSSKEEENNKVTPAIIKELQKIERAMSKDDMPKAEIMNFMKGFLKGKNLDIKTVGDVLGNISKRELEALMSRTQTKKDGGMIKKMKSGGMVSKKKSKVAGRLALRGYGRALKGKK